MTEREDILKQIEFLHWRKAILNFKAGQVEDADPELADHYDAEWDADSNEIGRLQSRLREIEPRATTDFFIPVENSRTIGQLVQDCADGKLPFSGPGSLCEKISAMGYKTTSLYEMVRAAEGKE